MVTPLDPTPQLVALIHKDILDIMGRQSIITPDDLRGSAATLKAALMAPGKCGSPISPRAAFACVLSWSYTGPGLATASLEGAVSMSSLVTFYVGAVSGRCFHVSLCGSSPGCADDLCGLGLRRRQWPALASMQGKVLFVVIDSYAKQYLAQVCTIIAKRCAAQMHLACLHPSVELGRGSCSLTT